jgi:muramoyltetrapeptide carboxypeptidase LdcA involved in peptidoglycan recycling
MSAFALYMVANKLPQCQGIVIGDFEKKKKNVGFYLMKHPKYLYRY